MAKESQTQWQTHDGLTIKARLWTQETPKAIIALVHGLGEHSGRYEHVAQFFNELGYSFMGADTRGHGLSQGQRGHAPSYEDYMLDIDQYLKWIREHYPNLPIIIYGHSMGGNLVLNYLLRRQPEIKAAIVTGPLIKPAIVVPPWKLTLGKVFEKTWPTLSMPNGLDVNQLSQDPATAKAYSSDPLVHNKVTATFPQVINTGDWLLENATKLKTPLLLMHGTKDGLTSAPATESFAQKAGPLCQLKLWEGYFHEIHNEREKTAVFEHIKTWLTSV